MHYWVADDSRGPSGTEAGGGARRSASKPRVQAPEPAPK